MRQHNPHRDLASTEQRQQLLDDVLASRLSRRGWRLEFYAEFSAVLAHGRPVNHLLHGLLTVLTGVWPIVWLFAIGLGGERREAVYVDRHGNVSVRRLH